MTDCDVVIVGGGPAGLEAALVLSRTRKKIIVFDDPTPSRNAASHGVHNYLGFDGLLPTQVRDESWKQINKYKVAKLLNEKVVDIKKAKDRKFLVHGSDGTICHARRVILAMGYHDVYPNIDGFVDCWADTIIPCPFCDGYENKDRIWGIVPTSEMELEGFPKMSQNWTSRIKVMLPNKLNIELRYEEELKAIGIPVHKGDIIKIHYADSKVESVTLNTGEQVEVETLLWTPPEKQSPLIEKLVQNMGLELHESGYIKTDETQETNVKGVFAAGDVQGWTGALESANAGSVAGSNIIHRWYD